MTDNKIVFSQCKFENPIKFEFEPLPDITAYELSRLLPHLLRMPLYEYDWEKLGIATRHLRRIAPTVQEAAPSDATPRTPDGV